MKRRPCDLELEHRNTSQLSSQIRTEGRGTEILMVCAPHLNSTRCSSVTTWLASVAMSSLSSSDNATWNERTSQFSPPYKHGVAQATSEGFEVWSVSLGSKSFRQEFVLLPFRSNYRQPLWENPPSTFHAYCFATQWTPSTRKLEDRRQRLFSCLKQL